MGKSAMPSKRFINNNLKISNQMIDLDDDGIEEISMNQKKKQSELEIIKRYE
jgi:hypothetical protein